ncbi:MAG: hypothetical protein PWP65_2017 [Clostridia bacterium]|nr:hypothetical protein [Clostridia bacterium]
MENLVDVRGLACPEPVIHTKKALETLESGELTAIVDNEVARDNIVKLARSLDCSVQVEQQGQDYYIHIRKEGFSATALATRPGQVLLITTSALGQGSVELGEILLRNFLYTLAESEVLPQRLILLNAGVKLACEGSPALASLMELERKGVEVLACGTCLDYYQMKERLCVGSITNMYSVVEHLLGAEKVITL